jgi:hypothetical protein
MALALYVALDMAVSLQTGTVWSAVTGNSVTVEIILQITRDVIDPDRR